jgi:hypothetical protein
VATWNIQRSGDGKSASGLVLVSGQVHSALGWVVVLARVANHGRQPWAPAQAKLTSKAGGRLARVRAVQMKGPPLATGERALVVVEADLPPEELGPEFYLELADTDGQRTLMIPEVMLRGGERTSKGRP